MSFVEDAVRDVGDFAGDITGTILDPLDLVDTGGIRRGLGDITGR
jgi:hypothetical protein